MREKLVPPMPTERFYCLESPDWLQSRRPRFCSVSASTLRAGLGFQRASRCRVINQRGLGYRWNSYLLKLPPCTSKPVSTTLRMLCCVSHSTLASMRRRSSSGEVAVATKKAPLVFSLNSSLTAERKDRFYAVSRLLLKLRNDVAVSV